MNFSKLDSFLDRLPACGYPMAELAVAKEGKVIYRRTVLDPAHLDETAGKDLYWIFSATKVITCIAAMRLVERGMIRLDDPVSKYIPAFADMKVKNPDGEPLPAQNVMTVEHLFTMTGGLSYDIHTPAIKAAREKDGTTLEIVSAMADVNLLFEPGTHYTYSLCHDVLAAVIEVATGMTFGEYLKTNMFAPLGIHDMGFHPTEAQKERFFPMYNYKNGLNVSVRRSLYNVYVLSSQYESGGAGLFATVDDYIKIISVMANGGVTEDGYVLLRPETIAMMQENHLCEDARNDLVGSRLYGYGWGLCGRVHMNPTVSFSKSPAGEFGWDGAANAYAMIDPENKLALYFGTQLMGCNYGYHVIHPMLRDLVYDCLHEE